MEIKEEVTGQEEVKNSLNSNSKKIKVGFYSVDQCKDGWYYIGIESNLFPKISFDGNTYGTIEKYSYIAKNQDEFLLCLEGLKKEYNGYYTLILSGDTAFIRKDGLDNSRTSQGNITIKWGKTIQFRTTKKKKQRFKELGINPIKEMKTTKKLTPKNAIKEIFKVLEELKTEVKE